MSDYEILNIMISILVLVVSVVTVVVSFLNQKK